MRLVRRIRKHRNALIALLLYNLVVFFPVVFMGRMVSPNDIYQHYSPWREAGTYQIAQNPTLNDPATSWFTLMSLLKDEPAAFHWNPYIASGIPGFGSSAAAVLSPFILIPVLLLPLAWVYTGILFLKLNAAFLFAYGWLRQERLGRNGAVVGAVVVAGAGIYSVIWLWQITNATVLYPALLWIVRRTIDGRRTPIALMALIALAIAISGFPAAIAYGAWIAAIYAVVAMVRMRSFPIKGLVAAAVAVLIALLVALPSIVPFVQFIERSGYLEMREENSLGGVYPFSHWRSFFDPDRLGHPVDKNWVGDSQSPMTRNYVAATVYLGWLTIPLALAGLFNRRARARLFWLLTALVVAACMFGAPVIAPFVAELPGVRYSPLTRLSLLLPLAAGYLAAAGATLVRRFRGAIALAIAIVLTLDLGMFAGRFHPYLEPSEAMVRETSVGQFLRTQQGPYRVAPFFDFFWPNTSELVRVEDVRSQFGSEAMYRKMLQRLDPGSWSGTSTVITFNSLNFNMTDPLAGLLGIRWYIEQLSIDIVKWSTIAGTVPVGKETGPLPLIPGSVYQRTVQVDAEPFWAIELPVAIEEELTPDGRLHVELLKDGVTVWSRAFTKIDAGVVNKLYVPLRPYARLGESVELRVRSHELRGWLAEGENIIEGESPLYYARVTTPVIFDRQLPDARLFRNLAEIPRFRSVSRVRKLNSDEFLAARDIDFERETVITDDPVMVPEGLSDDARVKLIRYAPNQQQLATDASGPFFLASTEKLTPELLVTIDGRAVRPIQIDGLFAGLVVPGGQHEVIFARRIARGWWWTFFLGIGLWLIVATVEIRRGRNGGDLASS